MREPRHPRFDALLGRKVYGYTALMAVCAMDAWRHGITWPCAIVMILSFLGFVLGVSGEKILSIVPAVQKMVDKVKKAVGGDA